MLGNICFNTQSMERPTNHARPLHHVDVPKVGALSTKLDRNTLPQKIVNFQAVVPQNDSISEIHPKSVQLFHFLENYRNVFLRRKKMRLPQFCSLRKRGVKSIDSRERGSTWECELDTRCRRPMIRTRVQELRRVPVLISAHPAECSAQHAVEAGSYRKVRTD